LRWLNLLNDRVRPFFESKELDILRILTDRGSEYCSRADRYDYQLYMAVDELLSSWVDQLLNILVLPYCAECNAHLFDI
jgi:hypothetical protein